eukprot:6211981-Pleurochrysis_carterae.AAC.5
MHIASSIHDLLYDQLPNSSETVLNVTPWLAKVNMEVEYYYLAVNSDLNNIGGPRSYDYLVELPSRVGRGARHSSQSSLTSQLPPAGYNTFSLHMHLSPPIASAQARCLLLVRAQNRARDAARSSGQAVACGTRF